jgi:molybdopterin/thiamine biosynthesis adenylyltransferase
MESADISSSVVEAFKERGFSYIHRSATGFYALSGPLRTTEGVHQCVILLPPNFDTPPHISLTPVPDALKPIAPHIGTSGGICYLSRASIALNIFDPVGQMLRCLERAEEVLGQILRGELVQDLAEEFYAYWGDDFCHCFFDFKDIKSPHLRCLAGTIVNDLACIFFITDDGKRTAAKSKMLGYDVSEVLWPVVRIFTRGIPRASQGEWPPKTLGALLAWQKDFDSRACRKIEEGVAQAAERGHGAVVILVESPKFLYSFAVFFSRKSKIELRRKTTLFSCAIIVMHGWRVDERYITERNVPGMKTLLNKRIVLVGCGTVGGYLAEMLVKAGAGAGNGELLLIDDDTLTAGNLGRHRLGFPQINQNKAKALAKELKSAMPDANLRALGVKVQQSHLGKPDIIIDATGEQTVSDYLAVTYQQVPQLSAWVEGPGVAVRAFLRSSGADACMQCLTLHTRAGAYDATVEVLPAVFSGQGCEQEFVPFPGTVSIQAACLAAELVMDWVGGVASAALRTRIIDRAYKLKTADCAVPRFEGCPACAT